MDIHIETKNIKITPKFYRYIENRVNTLLESYNSDIKTLRILLSKASSGSDKIVCQIVMDNVNDKSTYARYRAGEITLALETAIHQLRIKLFEKVNKLHTLQSRIRFLKQNRNKFKHRNYQEINQQLIGV